MATAIFTVTSGTNEGDQLRLEPGTCRLVGRHLAEAETVIIDRDGNRLLDGSAGDILAEHLQEKAPPAGSQSQEYNDNAFARGADVILEDASISRAHAVIFNEGNGVGVVDLASTNGTFVDEEQVASMLMRDGSVLTVGNTHMALRLEG